MHVHAPVDVDAHVHVHVPVPVRVQMAFFFKHLPPDHLEVPPASGMLALSWIAIMKSHIMNHTS